MFRDQVLCWFIISIFFIISIRFFNFRYSFLRQERLSNLEGLGIYQGLQLVSFWGYNIQYLILYRFYFRVVGFVFCFSSNGCSVLVFGGCVYLGCRFMCMLFQYLVVIGFCFSKGGEQKFLRLVYGIVWLEYFQGEEIFCYCILFLKKEKEKKVYNKFSIF